MNKAILETIWNDILEEHHGKDFKPICSATVKRIYQASGINAKKNLYPIDPGQLEQSDLKVMMTFFCQLDNDM